MTPEEQELMTSFLKLVMTYLQRNPLKENVLIDYQDYESLEKKFDTSIGKKGILEEELLSSVQAYLKYCVRTNHPQFWGHTNLLALDRQGRVLDTYAPFDLLARISTPP